MGAAQPIKGKRYVDLYSAFILTHPIDGQVWIAQFYLQITPYCLYLVSVHQTALLLIVVADMI